MTTALDVAQFFITSGANSEEGGVSNLKLQKLVYYAQGFHLALFNAPLFDEDLEAWTHGPVIPSLYHQYKGCGSAPITSSGHGPAEVFSSERLDFLNEVHDVFGQFSAWKLRNMTHDERPWLENEDSASIIPKATMQEYFKTRLK